MVDCVYHILLAVKVRFANGHGIFNNLDDVLNMLPLTLFLICDSLFCKCSGKAVNTFNYYESLSHFKMFVFVYFVYFAFFFF